jgi:AraC-like DNA-binding protein
MGRIAAQAGFSRCHFIRLFRGAFGLTPYQYLKTRRLERAKELLATTILSVMDVCLDVGFESLGSFTSLFTRAVGETPGAYRAARRRRVCIPYCFVRMYRAEPLADATWAMGT